MLLKCTQLNSIETWLRFCVCVRENSIQFLLNMQIRASVTTWMEKLFLSVSFNLIWKEEFLLSFYANNLKTFIFSSFVMYPDRIEFWLDQLRVTKMISQKRTIIECALIWAFIFKRNKLKSSNGELIQLLLEIICSPKRSTFSFLLSKLFFG